MNGLMFMNHLMVENYQINHHKLIEKSKNTSCLIGTGHWYLDCFCIIAIDE